MAKSPFTVEVEIPGKLTLQKKAFDRLIDKLGPRVATKIRRALKSGSNVEGDPFPAGADGQPIDLEGKTKTLLGSPRYRRRSQSVEPTGRHPTCKKGNYGLMQILLSGKGKKGEQVREPFDPLGSEGEKVYEGAADELQGEIDKALQSGALQLEGSAYRIIKGKR